MPADDSGKEVENDPSSPSSASFPNIPTAKGNPQSQLTQPGTITPPTVAKEVVEEVRLAEHWLIGVGVASVMVSILLGIIYYQQLTEMRIATQASKEAVGVADDTLTTSSSQFDRSMAQAITQTQQAIHAAQAAKRAADIASDTLRKSQRPWVTAESFTPSTLVMPPEGKFGVDGDLIVKNTGTSVATDGWVMMVATPNGTSSLAQNWDNACRDVDEQIKANNSPANKTAWPIGFVLGPNQETRMRMGSGDPNGEIDAQIKKAITFSPFPQQDPRSGQFYLLGCARYKDQFGIGHTTRFCFIYLNDKLSPSGFYVCNAMETAD